MYLGIFVFTALWFLEIFPDSSMVGMLTSMFMTAFQTLTNAWKPIICQDPDNSRCFYLMTTNKFIQGILLIVLAMVVARMAYGYYRTRG